MLRDQGIWTLLEPAMASQARAVAAVRADLQEILSAQFLRKSAESPGISDPSDPGFLQEFFFLTLFRSLFEALGVAPERLDRYAELNFCVQGTITAADNLFDDQAKSLLPLQVGSGSRLLSILQLMCFERLIRRSLDRSVAEGLYSEDERDGVLRGLLNLMAQIGLLEGSEEGGVSEVLLPEEMVERVHRVRGGFLFALAFVAPKILEQGETRHRIERAEPAIARLGTAFQIVDDLTDFEFDLTRRSHNLLVSQIYHRGGEEEKQRMQELLDGAEPLSGEVEGVFRNSARAVLELAHREARAAFHDLAELGFWFPEPLADEVVHAIVGLEGVRRMEEVAALDLPSSS